MNTPVHPRPLFRRLRKLAIGLLIAVAIALPVRACLLTPYRIAGNSVAPEVRKGSLILVYRLASDFQSGDLVVYRNGDNDFVGRCESATAAALQVSRNDQRAEVPRDAIIGRVILNTR
jgi:signal peptidase I